MEETGAIQQCNLLYLSEVASKHAPRSVNNEHCITTRETSADIFPSLRKDCEVRESLGESDPSLPIAQFNQLNSITKEVVEAPSSTLLGWGCPLAGWVAVEHADDDFLQGF
ncbi:hypothetical protein [Arthrobacter sp. E3]|uniref:hypothetical protein n=1 Tax=Arthrobacter sp. E3 TaxID=517402 RepID=UPI001A952D40|nr:hypothetical protein [Arthrobacter sp. E3]